MRNVVCLVAALAVLVVAAEAQEAQTAFLATLTPEQIAQLSAQEGLDAMIVCYKQKDDPQCTELVTNTLAELPELLRTNCGLCSEAQRKLLDDVLDQVTKEFPDKFNQLRKLIFS
ncbi:hypothetical protein OTU49_008608 [Cherax quadricarinatus]|uniref:Chemosensory protein n=2 Tax=Cherax quadricarinatus TaxID=27406 RepID=A0AAW0WBK0_CHEQU